MGLQPELLDHLRQSAFLLAEDRVDIFLHERLVDDAIAAVKRSTDYGLIERVMDTVVEQRPDWVIRTARRQADRIIDAGKAKYYHHAVNWLGRDDPKQNVTHCSKAECHGEQSANIGRFWGSGGALEAKITRKGAAEWETGPF